MYGLYVYGNGTDAEIRMYLEIYFSYERQYTLESRDKRSH